MQKLNELLEIATDAARVGELDVPDRIRQIAKEFAAWHIENCKGELLQKALLVAGAITEYAAELAGE